MLLVFTFLSGLCIIGLRGSQDGQYSDELWNLMVAEQEAGRIMGYIAGLFPKSAKFYNGNLGVIMDKRLLNNKDQDIVRDITVFGEGFIDIMPTKYPINIDIIPPKTKENVCGLILASLGQKNPIKKVQILFKSNSRMPWDLLSVPNNGEYLFDLGGATNEEKRVIQFDPVPVSNIRLFIHAKDGEGLKINVALIYGCQFGDTIKLSCDEVLDQNPKFYNMQGSIPMSISCPLSCVKTRPCIGYKVYSSESPICSVAIQALGDNGDGSLFLYKIFEVALFRDQVNPLLNNGIYCRKSTVVHSGITFNRVYYDFSVKEYQKLKGS